MTETKPQQEAGPDLRTPLEWAQAKGLILAPRFDFQGPQPHWKYAAADALYGWAHHAYHFQGEDDVFRITEKDFELAIEAAAQFPAKPAHEPGVAPSCPHKAEFARAKAEAARAESAKKEKR